MVELNIEYLPLGSLRPYPRNARTHSRKQIRQIADSIATFGFTNPILVDRNGMILAGHGRVEAARLIASNSDTCIDDGKVLPRVSRGLQYTMIEYGQVALWRDNTHQVPIAFGPNLDLQDLARAYWCGEAPAP